MSSNWQTPRTTFIPQRKSLSALAVEVQSSSSEATTQLSASFQHSNPELRICCGQETRYSWPARGFVELIIGASRLLDFGVGDEKGQTSGEASYFGSVSQFLIAAKYQGYPLRVILHLSVGDHGCLRTRNPVHFGLMIGCGDKLDLSIDECRA